MLSKKLTQWDLSKGTGTCDGEIDINDLDNLIKARFQLYNEEVAEWLITCVRWHPEHTVPVACTSLAEELVHSVKSTVQYIETQCNGPFSVDASVALPQVGKAPMHGAWAVKTSGATDLASSAMTRPSTTLDAEARSIADLLCSHFLNKLCDLLTAAVAWNREEWHQRGRCISQGVDMLRWICQRPRSPRRLRDYCETKRIVNTLVQLCQVFPVDVPGFIQPLRSLRAFMCRKLNPPDVRKRRILELIRSGFFSTFAGQIDPWMGATLPARSRNGASSQSSSGSSFMRAAQVLDSMHELFKELLDDENVLAAIQEAHVVNALFDLMWKRLLHIPILWPRALTILMNLIATLNCADHVRRGLELSKKIREMNSEIGKGLQLPSMFCLKMEELRQHCTYGGEARPGTSQSRRTSLSRSTPRRFGKLGQSPQRTLKTAFEEATHAQGKPERGSLQATPRERPSTRGLPVLSSTAQEHRQLKV